MFYAIILICISYLYFDSIYIVNICYQNLYPILIKSLLQSEHPIVIKPQEICSSVVGDCLHSWALSLVGVPMTTSYNCLTKRLFKGRSACSENPTGAYSIILYFLSSRIRSLPSRILPDTLLSVSRRISLLRVSII